MRLRRLLLSPTGPLELHPTRPARPHPRNMRRPPAAALLAAALLLLLLAATARAQYSIPFEDEEDLDSLYGSQAAGYASEWGRFEQGRRALPEQERVRRLAEGDPLLAPGPAPVPAPGKALPLCAPGTPCPRLHRGAVCRLAAGLSTRPHEKGGGGWGGQQCVLFPACATCGSTSSTVLVCPLPAPLPAAPAPVPVPAPTPGGHASMDARIDARICRNMYKDRCKDV